MSQRCALVGARIQLELLDTRVVHIVLLLLMIHVSRQLPLCHGAARYLAALSGDAPDVLHMADALAAFEITRADRRNKPGRRQVILLSLSLLHRRQYAVRRHGLILVALFRHELVEASLDAIALLLEQLILLGDYGLQLADQVQGHDLIAHEQRVEWS